MVMLVIILKYWFNMKNNKEIGLPIRTNNKKGHIIEYVGDSIDIFGRMQYHRGTVQHGIAHTLKTTCDVGVLVYDNRKSE